MAIAMALCASTSRFATAQLAKSWLFFLITAGATYSAPPLLFPLVKAEFGLSASQVALLPTVFLVAKGVFALPAGEAMHRYGAARCIRWGALLLAVVTAAYPCATSAWVLVLLHVGFGAAYCFCGLAALVVHCSSCFPEHRKGVAIGTLITAFSASGV